MRGRKLGAAAFIVLMVGMVGPMALAGDTHSSVFTFTTSSNNGTRVISTFTAPTFAAIDLNTSGGTVASTAPATTSVTEVFAAGANFAVTAQICGPTNQATVTSTAALAAGTADCSGGNGNQFAGYNSTSGAYQTSIAGSRVTATSSLANAGSSVSPLLHGTATTTASSTMAAPVTVLNAGSSELSTSSYNGSYSATTNLSISNVTDNATWVGFWVTTLTP